MSDVGTALDWSRGFLGRGRVDPGGLAAVLILILGGWASLSVDPVRAGYGIKGDEATYVAMALSAAYDRDLTYERRDLERFFQTYDSGPEGIFLKRGRDLQLEVHAGWPPITLRDQPDRRRDRLFFGKPFIYSVAAAPFVWMAGLNGMLLFHVVLLAGVVFAGYRFVAARSAAAPAVTYVLAFLGASIVPLYAILLSSEIFNFSLVFFAYFAWCYKEVAPAPAGVSGWWRRGVRSDVLAAVLLGLATYSRLPHGILIVPPVLWLWHRRRWADGVRVAAVFGVVAVSGFGVHWMITGDYWYQGGDRRTYYGDFPFQSADTEFADAGIPVSTAIPTSTTEVSQDEERGVEGFAGLLSRNIVYFFVGRHFGFVPFFFPGVVAVVLAFMHRRDLKAWHLLVLASAAGAAAFYLLYTPYSWSGGGGPSGNRYYLSTYPVLFFLTPPLRSVGPALVSWLGGSLFTAQILLNPFVSTKQPYMSVHQGAFRWLPVELTMVNDLPIMLDPSRSRVVYQADPTVLLYFLDDEAYLPEPPGIWIAGGSRADIILRTDGPLTELRVTLSAPVDNEVTVRVGGSEVAVDVRAGVPAQVTLSPRGVFARQSWAYLLSVTTRDGFIPRLQDPGSTDTRYLGVALRLTPSVGVPR